MLGKRTEGPLLDTPDASRVPPQYALRWTGGALFCVIFGCLDMFLFRIPKNVGVPVTSTREILLGWQLPQGLKLKSPCALATSSSLRGQSVMPSYRGSFK